MNRPGEPRLGRMAHNLIRQFDRWGMALFGQNGGVRIPVSAELSRRSLWGMLPRRRAPCPDRRRLLALSFDLDYQSDTDALIDLVDLVGRVGGRMSVVAIGKLVEADAEPYRVAVEAGHEIVNHTWSHPNNPVLNPDREFWHLTEAEMTEEIARAQEIFVRRLGVRPRGFRSPHFKDAQRLLRVLERCPEIDYLSSALASKTPVSVPYFPTTQPIAGDLSLHFPSQDAKDGSGLLMIPLTPCPDHRWSPFSSYEAIRRPRNRAQGAGLHTVEEFASLWRRLLTQAWADGFASVYFDPADVMRDQATSATFEAMLRWAVETGWTLSSLAEVADVWREYRAADAGIPTP